MTVKKLQDLPGIDDDNLRAIHMDRTAANVWTLAIMDSLSLWHDADPKELQAYLEAFKFECQIEVQSALETGGF